jgi:hypothetical protein
MGIQTNPRCISCAYATIINPFRAPSADRSQDSTPPFCGQGTGDQPALQQQQQIQPHEKKNRPLPGRHPCHQHTGVLPPYLLTSIKSAACGTRSESSVEAPTLCSHVGRRECPKPDLLFRDEAANDHKAPARRSAMQTPEAYRCFGLTLSVSKRSGPVRAVAKPLRHP